MAEVAVIGTGYVGLTTGAYLAHLGHNVVCADVVPEKVAALSRGEVPIHEAGLDEFVHEGLQVGPTHLCAWRGAGGRTRRVRVSLPADAARRGRLRRSVLRRVGGARDRSARADRRDRDQQVDRAGRLHVAGRRVARIATTFTVVSNPEFLREGQAVYDSLNPDRIVIGAHDQEAALRLAELYESLHAPVLVTDPASAETIKYVANAFLATKVSFINAVAHFCELVGADVKDVALGMGQDKRIGFEFLRPGPGWGGSCFPKDTRALIHMAEDQGYPFDLLRSVVSVNNEQYDRVVQKIAHATGGSVDGKTIAVWGLTFKARTDDLRESPSLFVIERLRAQGAIVKAFDPMVTRETRRHHRVWRRVCGGRRRRVSRGLDRVGRVPSSRHEKGAQPDGGARNRRRPQPPGPRGGSSRRLHLRRHRTAVNVVVTGGAGFLGSHLCRALLARGDHVTAIDNLLTGSLDNIEELFAVAEFSFVHARRQHVCARPGRR